MSPVPATDTLRLPAVPLAMMSPLPEMLMARRSLFTPISVISPEPLMLALSSWVFIESTLMLPEPAMDTPRREGISISMTGVCLVLR